MGQIASQLLIAAIVKKLLMFFYGMAVLSEIVCHSAQRSLLDPSVPSAKLCACKQSVTYHKTPQGLNLNFLCKGKKTWEVGYHTDLKYFTGGIL